MDTIFGITVIIVLILFLRHRYKESQKQDFTGNLENEKEPPYYEIRIFSEKINYFKGKIKSFLK